MKIQEKLDALMRHAEPALAKTGQRFTKPRIRVLETLLKQAKPLKAYDIIEDMGDVQPMTVYRALDFLSSHGLIHRIESLNAYTLCTDDHCRHTDSQYMICEQCDTLQEIHDHSLDKKIAAVISETGFKINSKSLEIKGLCHECLT